MIRNFIVEERQEDQNGIYNYCSLFVALANAVKLGGNGKWIDCVKEMGKWYESNIHTYQTGTDNHAHGRKGWYKCPLVEGKDVADDCSGYVQACLNYFGVECPPITTATMNMDAFKKMMEDIYAGDSHSWSWGSIHDGQNGHQGMPSKFCRMDSRGGYIHCWRI